LHLPINNRLKSFDSLVVEIRDFYIQRGVAVNTVLHCCWYRAAFDSSLITDAGALDTAGEK